MELIYRVKEQLSRHSESVINNLYYGYGNLSCLLPKINKLTLLNGALEREYISERRLHPTCLKDKYKSLLVERILESIEAIDCEIERLDLEIDSSGFASWAISNPNCVPKEKWEIYCYNYICNTDFKITANNLGECLKFDMTKKDITPKLVFLISITKKDCGIKFDVIGEKENCIISFENKKYDRECKVNFTTLKEKYNCDIDLNTYKQVYACIQSHDIIRYFYDCGVDLSYNKEKMCYNLHVNNNTYPACDLPIEDVTDPDIINALLRYVGDE